MIAIAFLGRNPQSELIDFYKKLDKTNHDIFYFIDNNEMELVVDREIKFIQIDDQLCIEHGFHSLTHVGRVSEFGKTLSSWDKAVFYFFKVNKSYDHIWFVEDDVFVPTHDVFKEIDQSFIEEDLLSVSNVVNRTGEFETWHWWHSMLKSNLPLPWAMSMCCAIRVSSKLINTVGAHISLNKNCEKFHEFIFHTLAIHNDLTVREIKNLEGILNIKDWEKEEINNQTLFHPVKSMAKQVEFREYLAKQLNHPKK
jgi:hypothetical protein